jgi:hypothetical protein
MFLLLLKGGPQLFFRNSLELLVGLEALAGRIEEVRTVSPRLVLIKTFSGDTFSVGMIPPADFAPADLTFLFHLPVLPFSVKAHRDM